MDPLTTAALLTAVLGALTTLGGTWLRGRVRHQMAREEARRDHIRHLPPGSRLLDLGRIGMVIEISGHPSRSDSGRSPRSEPC